MVRTFYLITLASTLLAGCVVAPMQLQPAQLRLVGAVPFSIDGNRGALGVDLRANGVQQAPVIVQSVPTAQVGRKICPDSFTLVVTPQRIPVICEMYAFQNGRRVRLTVPLYGYVN